VGRKRRTATERAREWVRNNSYDSGAAEKQRFFEHMEKAAAVGDFPAKDWVWMAKAQAGRKELLRAANTERIRVPIESFGNAEPESYRLEDVRHAHRPGRFLIRRTR
jgi:hypothetical protein